MKEYCLNQIEFFKLLSNFNMADKMDPTMNPEDKSMIYYWNKMIKSVNNSHIPFYPNGETDPRRVIEWIEDQIRQIEGKYSCSPETSPDIVSGYPRSLPPYQPFLDGSSPG